MGIFEKIWALILLVLFVVVGVFAIGVEEEAKLKFGDAHDLWLKGEYEKALNLVETILYKPIDVNDITKFWYLRARIQIDLGKVKEALRSLRNVLVLNPSSSEVLALIKEIEFLLGEKKFSKDYRLKQLGKIQGFKNGMEYFYTVDDVAVWGKKIFLIDRVNSRFMVYENLSLVRTVVLPFRPLSLEVSPDGVPYISGVEGGIYRLDGNDTTEVATGLNSPLLAGFDRSGTLWGVSGFKVFSFNGSVFKISEIPWGRPLITDAEMTRRGLWILDNLHRRLVLMDPATLELLRDIPLQLNVREFEVTPYGDFLLLTSDGRLVLMDDELNLRDLELNTENVVPMEYYYPILLMADWKEHTVNVYSFAGNEPVLVKIDRMKVDRENGTVELSVRFEDLYGDPIKFADEFAFVSLDGGRIGFESDFYLERVEEYKSDLDFLTEKLPSIARGVGYDVVIPRDSFASPEDVVTLRDKSVRIFTRSEPESEVLKRLVTMSGGSYLSEPHVSIRELWNFKFSYSPSVSTKIIPISVGVVLGSEMYMDTVYITERGINVEGE